MRPSCLARVYVCVCFFFNKIAKVRFGSRTSNRLATLQYACKQPVGWLETSWIACQRLLFANWLTHWCLTKMVTIFSDDIFTYLNKNEHYRILFKMSLAPIDNKSAFGSGNECHRADDKQLPETTSNKLYRCALNELIAITINSPGALDLKKNSRPLIFSGKLLEGV